MGRIEGIEKPLWHLDACVGGEKDGKGRQDSEDGPVDGVSGDLHTEGILHLSAPQGRQPEEHIVSRPAHRKAGYSGKKAVPTWSITMERMAISLRKSVSRFVFNLGMAESGLVSIRVLLV